LYPRPKEAWVKDEKGTHHYQKKIPNKKTTPTTLLNLLKIPPPPKPKESVQPSELKTSKQMRTTLRQMKPLAYLTSYSQAQLPPAQTQSNRWAS